ncbi:hypothetical protein [Ammoniphilus sp. YIM 78166]|uniref:hypothetical protein n=1 Tax=Ammoniphilus sp. YIM 78166 TaxID=1644106 RepID=UPI0010702845|nr:hypothetical protein [Ammoniphilus sp. YIM 78166]
MEDQKLEALLGIMQAKLAFLDKALREQDRTIVALLQLLNEKEIITKRELFQRVDRVEEEILEMNYGPKGSTQ